MVALTFVPFILSLYLAGTYMIWNPRQCAVLTGSFIGGGNSASPRSRSVCAAIFEMRMPGLALLSVPLLYISLVLTPDGGASARQIRGGTADEKGD